MKTQEEVVGPCVKTGKGRGATGIHSDELESMAVAEGEREDL